jgi:TonB family protein
MFQALIESGPRAPVSPPRYLLSCGIHGLVIAAAGLLTRHSMDAAQSRPVEVVMPLMITRPAPAPPPESRPALPEAPLLPPEGSISEIPIPAPMAPLEAVPTVADLLGEQSSRREQAVDFDRLGLGSGGTGTDTVALPASAVDEQVGIIRQPAPEYPPALAQARITGRVELVYVVDTTGLVEPSSVLALSSTHPAFEAAARAAILASRYRPATLNGRIVRQLVRQTLTFRLRDQ